MSVIPIVPVNEIKPKQPRSEPKSKHDSLHMMEGLAHCWCMCAKCWKPYAPRESKSLGVCICPQCPCRKVEFSMVATNDYFRYRSV
jgi:hypothetical protein